MKSAEAAKANRRALATRPQTPRPKRAASTRANNAPVRQRGCSIARTVDILSDAWAFLVIREAFFGARRFETFRAALGLPRGTLTERLRALTAQGIFRQAHYSQTSSRVEYRLTNAGLDLYPSFMALMQFGDRWLSGKKGPPLQLIHIDCGKTCKPIVACSSCLEPVDPEHVSYRDGPGAGRIRIQETRRSRRASDPAQFNRGRPSSVSRTLGVMGDRWTFLIIREAFFDVRRFDKLLAELNIAPNILTDRLGRLIENGIFVRSKYQDLPERFEYRLTDMGKDLYGSFCSMMAWGDRWLAKGEPPLLLKHQDCGKDFTPRVVCDQCRKPVTAHNMKYQLRYDPSVYESEDGSGRVAPGRI